jgi:hypothetical protein
MKDEPRWLDEPRNVTRIVHFLAAACALALIADAFYSKHPHSAVEGWFGFYAVYGFCASVALVLTGKQLRRLLRRDEDFYEGKDAERDGD